jgi:hypothetical protein
VLKDEADGELDGGAVLGQREVQDWLRVHLSRGTAAARRMGLVCGAAGGVVVVAEVFVAKAGAAAAAAVGEDVAALEAAGFGGLRDHFGLSG